MLRARYFHLWVLVVLLLLSSLIGASVGGPVHAAGNHSLAQDQVVISEFRPSNPSGPNDGFVEIFNPTPATTLDISGFLIRSINITGGRATIYTFPSPQTLLPGQHYLVAGIAYGNTPTSDGIFSSGGIPSDGGVAITLPDGNNIIDKAGMNAMAAEGSPPLPQLSISPDQSYERRPGAGAGSCYDSNSSIFDFKVSIPPDPQTLGSALTVCAAATPTSTFTPSDTGNPTDTATSTPTYTNTPTQTPTFTQTPTLTQTGTGGVTPTVTPSAPGHMVISEFRSRGPYGADDEFVELYNPTGAAINIGGWIIKRSASCGTTTYNLFTITSGTIIQAGQHFLAASAASHISSIDQTFSPALADDGGLALISSSGSLVDLVGMCISTQYREGNNLPPLSGDADQSYERLPGGSTACYDLDNNATDFFLNTPATPLNKASPIVMCAGVPVYTPTRTPTKTPTRTPPPTATTLPGSVVINEFLPHPNTDWNGDGLTNTGDEYIELINMGTASISLKNWKLDNGVGGPSVPFVLPDVTLLPHQIVVFFHSDSGIGLSDGGGTVRLLKPDGRTADIYNYPLVVAVDETWCRLPDGKGAWAFACYPTPGKLNALFVSVTPAPGSTPGASAEQADPICLANTAPQPVLSAECNSPGGGIWRETGSGEFWLPGRGKWAVFVE